MRAQGRKTEIDKKGWTDGDGREVGNQEAGRESVPECVSECVSEIHIFMAKANERIKSELVDGRAAVTRSCIADGSTTSRPIASAKPAGNEMDTASTGHWHGRNEGVVGLCH